jgi:chaperone required for assembly of F1-ATPase
MKRFWREVTVEAVSGAGTEGWRVALDGRGIKTALGRPQVVPGRPLSKALADEWRVQPEEIDPTGFVFRDLADYALDVVAPTRDEAIERLLRFAETDTLCYRAEPDEPLAGRQRALWEPLLKRAETRYGVRFERLAGVMHRPQPAATLERLRAALAEHDSFVLAALQTMASLAASLTVALAGLEPAADAEALWKAANLEEDWQAEQWGEDAEAQALRERRLHEFAAALRFAQLARE